MDFSSSSFSSYHTAVDEFLDIYTELELLLRTYFDDSDSILPYVDRLSTKLQPLLSALENEIELKCLFRTLHPIFEKLLTIADIVNSKAAIPISSSHLLPFAQFLTQLINLFSKPDPWNFFFSHPDIARETFSLYFSLLTSPKQKVSDYLKKHQYNELYDNVLSRI